MKLLSTKLKVQGGDGLANDNTALAVFIKSLGTLNDYASSIAQTKKALDIGSSQLLSSKDDQVIFEDALKGIKKIQKIVFTAQGIIAINKEFDGDSKEQPTRPGHLRNTLINGQEDVIAV
jgi:hypothetical protein